MTPKLTAIGSGKGGTGKTLIATALASTLASTGERVLLLDADLPLSNTTLQLGLSTGGDLPGFISGRVRLDDAVVSVEAENDAQGNFDLLASPSGSCDLVDFDSRAVQRLMARLLNVCTYDRILIDLGAGVGASTMSIAAHADETLLVLTHDPSALADSYAFTKALLRHCGGNIKFVVNMVENAADAHRTADAFVSLCRAFQKAAPNYLGPITRDPNVASAVRLQRPPIAMYPHSPFARSIALLAQRIHGVGFPSPRLSVVQAPR